MKNQLENWEAGLGDRLKEHEFSFDPNAMAGFETLLAAETAVAGQPAPSPVTAPAPTGGSALAAKIFALLGCALLVGGLLYLGLRTPDTEVEPAVEVAAEESTPAVAVPTPAVTDFAPATPAPLPTPAPAAAAVPVDSRTVGQRTAGSTSVGETVPASVPAPERSRPRPLPTEGMVAPTPSPRRPLTIAPMRVHKPIMALPVPQYKLPEVQVIPARAIRITRDRSTLFPDVIDHRP